MCSASCWRVPRCIGKGLVGGEGFAVEASMIKADANRQNSTPGDRWEPPDNPGHAVREYLAVLDEAAFGGATPVVPKFIATADPASRWTGANGGLAFFAYSDNYLIDLDHAVIVDVEATTSVRQAEVTAARRMIERTRARFGLWPERPTLAMAMPPTSLGLSRRRASSRTSPCSTARRDATERSNEPSSSTIMPTTATSARAASACGNDGRCIANHARSSMRTA